MPALQAGIYAFNAAMMDRSRIISLGFGALYALLVLALALIGLFLLAELYRSLFMMAAHFLDLNKQEVILTSLALLNVALIAGLVLSFVHALLARSSFKIVTRSLILIVGISAVSLLQNIIDIRNYSIDQLIWSASLHGVLLVTAIVVFVIEHHGGTDRSTIADKKFLP